MRWKDYEAAVMASRGTMRAMPSLTDCVLKAFESTPVLSRTMLVHKVSLLTGIEKHEVLSNISNLLKAMEKANLVRHTDRNEWRLI